MKVPLICTVSGALAATLVIFILWGLNFPAVIAAAESRTGLAAWVQAFGSIIAIIGSASVAIWLSERDRTEARRLVAADRVSAVASIVFRAEATIRTPWNALSDDGVIGYRAVFDKDAIVERERIQDRCKAAMEAIPLHELADWELASLSWR